MEFKTKEEWVAAVNAYKAKHGTTRGFHKGPGKNQFVDSNGVTWDYKAGSNGGPGGSRRASSTDAYTTRRLEMEVDQTLGAADNNEATKVFNQAAVNAGAEKGVDQMHHMRTLNQFEPLLAGLNDAELEEALLWFQSEGFDLGNLEGNLKKQFTNAKAGGTTVSNTHQGTGSIHEWMRKHRLEPNTKQKEYKQLADMFKGKSLNERLPMYVNYLEYVQGAVQEKLEVPTAYDWINDTRKGVGTIPSGPRAGQRLPVNRATLADKIINDIRTSTSNGVVKLFKNPAVRRVATVLPIAGTLLGAGTVEVNAASRDEEIAANPNDPTLHVNKALDQISGWGDRTSLAGMAATATGAGAPVGIPATAVGELTSLGAGLASMAIDATRGTINLIRNPEKIKELKPDNLEFTTM